MRPTMLPLRPPEGCSMEAIPRVRAGCSRATPRKRGSGAPRRSLGESPVPSELNQRRLGQKFCAGAVAAALTTEMDAVAIAPAPSDPSSLGRYGAASRTPMSAASLAPVVQTPILSLAHGPLGLPDGGSHPPCRAAGEAGRSACGGGQVAVGPPAAQGAQPTAGNGPHRGWLAHLRASTHAPANAHACRTTVTGLHHSSPQSAAEAPDCNGAAARAALRC